MANAETERETLGDRIASLHPGQSRLKFAQELGIPDSTLGNYERNDRVPDADFLAHLRRKTSVNINWLITGYGEAFAPSGTESGVLAPLEPESLDLIRVPRYNVAAAAGDGLVPVDEFDDLSTVVLARSFIRRLGGAPEQCHVIFARGESMLPTIPEGSLLLIDRSKNHIEDNAVFVFRVGEAIKVKRARWRIDQRIDLVSDNQLAGYPPETYSMKEMEHITPIGRVICIMRGP